MSIENIFIAHTLLIVCFSGVYFAIPAFGRLRSIWFSKNVFVPRNSSYYPIFTHSTDCKCLTGFGFGSNRTTGRMAM